MRVIEQKNSSFYKLKRYETDDNAQLSIAARQCTYGDEWVIRIEKQNDIHRPGKVVWRHECETSADCDKWFDLVNELLRTDGQFWLRR